ncbi:MAG TPA: HNH endonuclease [Burkholderiaceae bacterium]
MNAARMLSRPIFGGPFGHGVYALATLPTISNGLHAVRWLVVEPRRGNVLAVADEKREALATARRLLLALPTPVSANDATWQQASLWPELPLARPPKVRSISRRRREVFERSQGRCAYCRAELAIHGPWHVEHQVPRALDGTEEPGNLVAACAPCNLAKSDRTALEFVLLET